MPYNAFTFPQGPIAEASLRSPVMKSDFINKFNFEEFDLIYLINARQFPRQHRKNFVYILLASRVL